MRIARLRLKNWKCYRGEHVLDLEAKTYAIVAVREGDPMSSNWAGKSSTVQAVDFALYGRLPEGVRADDWITEGEASGEVELVVDSGERIVRSRHRGKSTKAYFWRGQDAAYQERAEEAIRELVGLDAEEFRASSYFEQKKMAAFILAKPEERMRVVSSWFGLEKLEKCSEIVAEKASSRRALCEKRVGALEVLVSRRQALEQGTPEGMTFEAWGERRLGDLGLHLVSAEKVEAECARKVEELVARSQHESRAARYDQIVVEGQALSAQRADPEPLRSQAAAIDVLLHESSRELGEASATYRTKAAVAERRFDGTCPVVGAPCPARVFVEGKAASCAREAVELSKELMEKNRGFQELERSRREILDALSAQEALAARLDQMRAEAKRLKASRDLLAGEGVGAEKLEAGRLELDEARGSVRVLRAALQEVTHAVQEGARIAKEIAKAKEDLAEAEAGLRVYAEAQAVFGRAGAQKRVAEAGLGAIERGANRRLAAAGIDLRVTAEWSREGKDPAKTCASCGAAFPSSAKVKACARCGAERGLHLIHKLSVILSDRSGAAEDLAGIAFQLSASAWLRRARGAAWSVALIDEAFGSLDEANRGALASHLTGMLKGEEGFEQAFVIAHHPQVLDSLPGRIEVVQDRSGDSRVNVIA